MPNLPVVTLREGRDRSLQRRHPWIFSGAVASVSGRATAGTVARVVDHRRRFVAYAGVNPDSQIAGRVWSFDEDDVIDDSFVAARVRASIARRAVPDDGAARLVYSESDGVPGLVVDRYAGTVVAQFTAAAAEHWREVIADTLASVVPSVFERSDMAARSKEGLIKRTGSLRGAEPPDLIEVRERDHRFLVDVWRGHKTGFYLDQSANRERVASYAEGRRALNVFSYTGAFSVALAAAGAASVRSVDSSEPALARVKEHGVLNAVDLGDTVNADAFAYLRDLRDGEERFDLIVLDPPKLASSQAQVSRAARGYKDLNWLALRLLNPGGLLATFSCSGAIDTDLFRKIVAGAALDAEREARIVERFSQASDHPVLLSLPESQYLKGLLIRVD